jgi:hypothetical protein
MGLGGFQRARLGRRAGRGTDDQRGLRRDFDITCRTCLDLLDERVDARGSELREGHLDGGQRRHKLPGERRVGMGHQLLEAIRGYKLRKLEPGPRRVPRERRRPAGDRVEAGRAGDEAGP